MDRYHADHSTDHAEFVLTPYVEIMEPVQKESSGPESIKKWEQSRTSVWTGQEGSD